MYKAPIVLPLLLLEPESMTSHPIVLIVDDDPDTLSSLADLLTQNGIHPRIAASLKEARELSTTESVDAVLLDDYLPDGSGIEWVPELRLSCPHVAIIIITGRGGIAAAVKAIHQGADDYLTKPLHVEELLVVLERSLEIERLKWLDSFRCRLKRKDTVFVGQSPAVKRMWMLVQKAAHHEASILLQGETGVGKGVLARWIHDESERHSKPFVELNCSCMGGELLLSELFGHRKGSFTSAIECHEGLLEFADGGTLFLDEIGDMELSVQAQFLKVVEERRFRRVGETKSRSSNFRLICATNRDLQKDSQEGRFRKDLFFRVNVFPIPIPPLRMCKEDISLLSVSLLSELGYEGHPISAAGIECLKAYDWPGNIRELRNVLERACLISEGKTLMPIHFLAIKSPSSIADVPFSPESTDAPCQLDAVEATHIQMTLSRLEGDVTRTASALGISRATLYRKIKKHHLIPKTQY